MAPRDVAVIGAGSVGASCAYELARAGLRVVLLEQQESPGLGCSYGSAGLVCPTHPTPLGTWSNVRTGAASIVLRRGPTRVNPERQLVPWLARLLWATARPGFSRHVTQLLASCARESLTLHQGLVDAGVRTSFRPAGTLALYTSQRALMQEMSREDAIRVALPPRFVAPQALRSYVGADVTAAGGVYTAGEGFVDSHRYVLGVAEACRSMGVEVVSGSGPVRLHRRGSRVERIETNAGTFAVDSVVVAAGVGSRGLAAQVGARLPVIGGTGYHAEFTMDSLDATCPIYLPEAHLVLTPLEGRARVSGMLDLGTPAVPVRTRLQGVLNGIRTFFPGLVAQPGAVWSGQRPCTPDSLPIVGTSRGVENLWYATGHGMMGIALAPITGRWVADMVTGNGVGAPQEFGPDRFGFWNKGGDRHG